jgi:hypothetical protein
VVSIIALGCMNIASEEEGGGGGGGAGENVWVGKGDEYLGTKRWIWVKIIRLCERNNLPFSFWNKFWTTYLKGGRVTLFSIVNKRVKKKKKKKSVFYI